MTEALLADADAVFQLTDLTQPLQVASDTICQSIVQSGKVVIAHCDQTKYCAQILSDGLNAQFNISRPPLPNFILKAVSSAERSRDDLLAQYVSLICQPIDVLIVTSASDKAGNLSKTLLSARRMGIKCIILSTSAETGITTDESMVFLNLPCNQSGLPFIGAWATLSLQLVNECQSKMFD